MITPRFTISQDDEGIKIVVFASFADISNTEVYIDDNIVVFYASPYYLRLHLPGKLVDNEKEKHTVTFDTDQGAFIICCLKQCKGEHFDGLDMLTDLLTPKGNSNVNKPLIEVLNTENHSDGSDADDTEIDWYYEQKLPSDEDENTLGFKYGFGNSYSNVFSKLRSELSGVIDVVDPDNKSMADRRKERLTLEENSFDEEHYLGDFYETETVEPFLAYKPYFYSLTKDQVSYSVEEEERLLQLPRKEILVDSSNRSAVFLGLIDIIYAFCFNLRLNQGDVCAEASWNISKISSTLSWLESFRSLNEVVTACMRRSLIFPLIRNWEMALKVIEDTVCIISLGRKQTLKCLLETHRIMSQSEDCCYILNELYVTDYCIWIQSVSDQKLSSLANGLKKISLTKSMIDLELDELEAASKLVIEEEENEKTQNVDDLTKNIQDLTVIENNFALLRSSDEDELPVKTNLSSNPQNICEILNEESSNSDDSSSSDSEEDSSSDSSTLDSDDLSEPEDFVNYAALNS